MPQRPRRFAPYDPKSGLENAGLQFLQQARYLCAINCFGELATLEPTYDMAWYGLGNALFSLAGERRDLEILKLSLACLRRTLVENENNDLALELEGWINRQTPLSAETFQACRAYQKSPDAIAATLGFNAQTLLEAWHDIKTPQTRMQIIMWLAPHYETHVGELLLAALTDPNQDVQMAALKRIYPWGDQQNVQYQIATLVDTDAYLTLEPYVSRTIHQISHTHPAAQGWAMILQRKIKAKAKSET
ncbi:MAG: hypothetical protein AAGC54_07115 [Cyanobacteria bacterium P01_F01_bin.4]